MSDDSEYLRTTLAQTEAMYDASEKDVSMLRDALAASEAKVKKLN